MKKCKKCGVKNKLNATFCANCGSELKTINIKHILIILVAIVVIIAGVGFIKIKFFDSASQDLDDSTSQGLELLNTKEARKKIFKDDKTIQKILKDSLTSDLDKIINDNYLCANDLYLDEPPEIEILEEDNKRIRNLGEGYYLVEEFNKDGNQGTLEYYLADQDFKKIDCSMNSGQYDVTLDSNDRITEIYQDNQLLYEIEYQGDDIIYYYENGNYIRINTSTKDYEITDDDEQSTTQTDYVIEENDEKYDAKYKNDLLISKINQDNYDKFNYYYDTNGLMNTYEQIGENEEKESISYGCYDFQSGYNYSLVLSEYGGFWSIDQYTIDFSFNPYNLVQYNVTNDFLKSAFYLGNWKQRLNKYGNAFFEDESHYAYEYEEKDVISSIEKFNYSRGYREYNFDKEKYYCRLYSQQGIFLKIDEIEEGKLSLRLKYYDKTNKENDIQLIDEIVNFDKKQEQYKNFGFRIVQMIMQKDILNGKIQRCI